MKKTIVLLFLFAGVSITAWSQKKGKLEFCDEVITSVSNTSKLNYKEIYYQKGGGRARVELPYYFGKFEVVKYENDLYFRFKNNTTLKVTGDTTFYERKEIPGKSVNPVINAHSCSQSSRVGYECSVETNLGQLLLRFICTYSDHTDFYKLSIQTEDGKLSFKNLMNTEIFLADSDNDGKDEIYVFTYSAERQEMKILKIYY